MLGPARRTAEPDRRQ